MPCRTHYIVTCLLDEMDDDRFTDWEREFIDSIAKRIEGLEEVALTEKQEEVLERIWGK